MLLAWLSFPTTSQTTEIRIPLLTTQHSPIRPCHESSGNMATENGFSFVKIVTRDFIFKKIFGCSAKCHRINETILSRPIPSPAYIEENKTWFNKNFLLVYNLIPFRLWSRSSKQSPLKVKWPTLVQDLHWLLKTKTHIFAIIYWILFHVYFWTGSGRLCQRRPYLLITKK